MIDPEVAEKLESERLKGEAIRLQGELERLNPFECHLSAKAETKEAEARADELEKGIMRWNVRSSG